MPNQHANCLEANRKQTGSKAEAGSQTQRSGRPVADGLLDAGGLLEG